MGETSFDFTPNNNFSEQKEISSPPKKDHNRTRNKAFNVRFTSEEFEMIIEKQLESKLTRSDFILALAREKPIYVFEHSDKLLQELNAQGKNINQIARALNRCALGFEKKNISEKDCQQMFERLSLDVENLQIEYQEIYKTLIKIWQEVL